MAFEDIRQDIIDGLTSAQTEDHGWNNEVRDKIAVTDVVRTSDTIVTITLPAEAAYDITAQETITITVPASALVGNAEIVATPTFTVDTSSAQISVNASRVSIELSEQAMSMSFDRNVGTVLKQLAASTLAALISFSINVQATK